LEYADWGDPEPTPPAAPLEPATSTSAHGPDPSSSTTWGPCKQPPQPTLAAPEEATAAVEGRQLLRGKHLGTFSIATRLRP
jgi:hypothetical protein